MNNEIESGLTEAFTAMYGDALCNEMLADKVNLLGDLAVPRNPRSGTTRASSFRVRKLPTLPGEQPSWRSAPMS